MKPLVESILQRREELRLRLGLEFDSFEPRLGSGILKCICWLNVSFFFFLEVISFFFGVIWVPVFWKGVKTYLMAPMSPPTLPTSFCLHICSPVSARYRFRSEGSLNLSYISFIRRILHVPSLMMPSLFLPHNFVTFFFFFSFCFQLESRF
jgi:hypothetical protein